MGTAAKQLKKIPELRFPDFNEKLTSSCLENFLLRITYGFTNPMPESVQGPYMLTAKDVTNGRIDYENCRKTTLDAYTHLVTDKCRPNVGDVLITKDGALGRLAVVDKNNVCINQSVALLQPNKDVVSEYLFHILNSQLYQTEMLSNSGGSTIKHLYITTLAKMHITVPTVAEQQKIADFLGSVDAWLDNLRQQKTALETYKRGMMQKLFTQQVRFKGDDGKDFPEWKCSSISDIGDSYGGLAGKSGEDFGKGEPYITYKQIFDSSVIEPEKFSYVVVGPKEKQNRSQYGDILFTVSSETPNEVGYASVLLVDSNPYLNSFSFGLRPKSLKEILPEFACYHFRSAPFRRVVIKLAQGSTRYNISKVQFMKLEIELPSSPEQKKIADFLTSLDQTINAKVEEITKVEQWKKGLMQKMFV